MFGRVRPAGIGAATAADSTYPWRRDNTHSSQTWLAPGPRGPFRATDAQVSFGSVVGLAPLSTHELVTRVSSRWASRTPFERMLAALVFRKPAPRGVSRTSMFRKPALLRGVSRPSIFRKQDTRELAFWNPVPEHEMAVRVAPHRRGPNGNLMVPFDRETDAPWGYTAVGPRLLALEPFAILAQTRTDRL